MVLKENTNKTDVLNIQLQDLIEFYPYQDDANFQALISNKEEFKEFASLPAEQISEVRRDLYRHQKFFRRYMRFYDRVLVLDRPGTGKTCKVIGAMEYFQKNRSEIRQFFVIVPNDAIKDDVRNQIICFCSDKERYQEPIEENMIKRNIKDSGKKKSINKFLGKYYNVMTHGEFARLIIDDYPDAEKAFYKHLTDTGKVEQIERDPRFSEKFYKKNKPVSGEEKEAIIIDIAKKYRKDLKIVYNEEEYEEIEKENDESIARDFSGSFFYIDEGHMLSITPKDIEGKSKVDRRKIRYYKQYDRVLHLIKRSKVVITTATPMVNSPGDIRSTINLLRSKDDPVPEDFDYENSTMEQVNRYFGGLVSYVAPIDNKVNVNYPGEQYTQYVEENGEEQETTVTVWPLEMQGTQEKIYNEALAESASTRGKAFNSKLIQASIFTYPNGKFGDTGWKSNTIEPKANDNMIGTSSGTWRRPKVSLSKKISTIEGIRDLSISFAEIIEEANNGEEGVIYVVTQYVKNGIIPLALCLEKQGYEVYRDTNSAFTSTEQRSYASVCPGREGRRLKENIIKRPRCGIYSADIFSSNVNRNTLELTSSSENVLGEYIRVIIVSPAGKVGININNVSKIYRLDPEWNESNNIQGEYRGIRATSHVAKINYLTRKYRGEGKNIRNVRAKVDVHRIATFNNEGESAILDRYILSRAKEEPIQAFFRKLMRVALDCNLNKNRNQYPSSKDGSLDCNYMKCQYSCYMPNEYDTDYDTYDIYYINERLEDIIRNLIPVIRDKMVISYPELFEMLSNIPEKQIVIALSELISKQRTIKDRFGYNVYVNESNGYIYLTREVSNDFTMSYYAKNLINVSSKKLTEIKYSTEDENEIIQELIDLGVGSDEFKDRLESLSIEVQADILEGAILDMINNDTDEFDDYILEEYRGKYFKENYPQTMIKQEQDRNTVNKSTKGRKQTKPKKANEVKRSEEDVIKDENTDETYFHILYTYKKKQTGYGTGARSLKVEGRYRLLIPSREMEWRDITNEYELKAYNRIAQDYRQQEERQFIDNFNVYGVITNEGKFSIVDKTQQKKGPNLRDQTTGKICSDGWTLRSLINVLYEIDYGYPADTEEHYNIEDLDDAISYISNPVTFGKLKLKREKPEEVANWDEDRIRHFYAWLKKFDERGKSAYNKNFLCGEIRRTMEEQGRINKNR